MQLSDLERELREDTQQQVPPFGADSIRTARELGTGATDFLLKEIKARGDTAFLALEALREADPGAYDSIPKRESAEIYVDALKNSSYFNTWGVPGYQLTGTARALIGLGDEAIPLLEPLLDDKRKAPLSGSQSATTSSMYGNRVCDYAWILISEIRQKPYRYEQEPGERDQSIEALRREL